MISLPRISVIFISIIITSVVAAQPTSGGTEDVYGSDPLLFNGKFYTFYPPLKTGNNQYFTDKEFEIGSATIRGVTFTDLLLNYDIYNQQLILKYKTKTSAVNQIIVSDAWLESFSTKGLNFKIILTQDTLKRIYQELGTGPKYILYYWHKDLKLDGSYGATNYIFSKPIKEMYLIAMNLPVQYRNNKSFCLLFDSDKRIVVKEYLRRHKIRIKKADDQVITELISFCNTL